jgi:carbon-monoxide dehydrogenase small subunit
MKRSVLLIVNGERHEVFIEPNRTLLGVLREELSLTGAKEACGSGECGACVVLVDGKTVNSCITLAMEAEEKEIETIEGLPKGRHLHPLQQSFIDHHAFQCGFCTPGMIMTAKSFLDRNSDPTRDEIRNGIAGNICRCTGYENIVDAVLKAAQEIKSKDQ